MCSGETVDVRYRRAWCAVPSAVHRVAEDQVQPVVLTDDVNKGTHMIHTGSQYDSHLLIPVVP